MKEIKELLQDIKKGKKLSNGGENQPIRKRNEKRMTSTLMDLTKMRKNHASLGLKGCSCPHLNGMTPKGQIARAANVLEVRNIKRSAKIHPAFISKEGNAGQWFKI
ncbi:hypothetical protein V8G54_033601 [Vigna mungo]|uniref:Uncharacterized protein n=1 Tax=Vigna mungo TaxID=3915 RepID=A0AAQ3RJ47_VIGMU